MENVYKKIDLCVEMNAGQHGIRVINRCAMENVKTYQNLAMDHVLKDGFSVVMNVSVMNTRNTITPIAMENASGQVNLAMEIAPITLHYVESKDA